MFHFAWSVTMAMRAVPVLVETLGIAAFELSSVVALIVRLLLSWMIAICLLWMIARQLDERLIQYATRDTLTGLSNRTFFLEQLDGEAAQLIYGGRMAVHYVDLDRFKPVNDSFGHAVGDDVLRVVASRLRAVVSSGSLVARLGGDEFAVIVTEGSRGVALDIATSKLARPSAGSRSPAISAAKHWSLYQTASPRPQMRLAVVVRRRFCRS